MNVDQSMASSSSSSVPSSRPSSLSNSQSKMEMESAKASHWSQLNYPTMDLEFSAESNFEYFALLKKDPQWGRFFTNFERLEVGEKISQGAQADIYEARNSRVGPFDLVAKVMKGDDPLKTFQAQWPIGMLSARSKNKYLIDLPLITVLGGTVLRDERLRGRFAFVMYRRWGDLRLLIDRRMKQERNRLGPFPIAEAIHLMSTIGRDMDALHNKHNIIHRDLKASNVLVWGELGGNMSPIDTPNRAERIRSVVADFECSIGVMGTWFWMAPEILEQLKVGVPSSEVRFTRQSDVYSYGMTCYEIVTGCSPYEGLELMDGISQILQGRCPKLPQDLPEFVRNMIVSCWHFDPLERANFSTICMALEKRMNVIIDNKSKSGASIVKVETWNLHHALTLLEVMQILMDMDLSILKAFDSPSISIIMQYFQVLDCKGRKVVEDKSIANIRKNPKSMNLTRPCNSSYICVHLRKGAGESVQSTEVIVCLESGWPHVSKYLGFNGYKIVRASIEYPVPYNFLQNRGKSSEDIDFGTLGDGESDLGEDELYLSEDESDLSKDETKKIYGIQRVANERRCPEGNVQLIVSGPRTVVHDDLMRSLHRRGLVVTGGQVYREFGTGLSDPSGDLVYFVSEKPRAEGRRYSSIQGFYFHF